ncbi:hypothetical protein B0T22DRAFT_227930 [Podospora appendiculata]|uniref:Uncharacterized protein n=1 Tax=Podospora appendiculata TaxID=314037 RepID=A0AAE0X6J0_9PEZI|nr:hypothetical protein B0T22DRAFT_227930 [Podospora appendiculata]
MPDRRDGREQGYPVVTGAQEQEAIALHKRSPTVISCTRLDEIRGDEDEDQDQDEDGGRRRRAGGGRVTNRWESWCFGGESTASRFLVVPSRAAGCRDGRIRPKATCVVGGVLLVAGGVVCLDVSMGVSQDSDRYNDSRSAQLCAVGAVRAIRSPSPSPVQSGQGSSAQHISSGSGQSTGWIQASGWQAAAVLGL